LDEESGVSIDDVFQMLGIPEHAAPDSSNGCRRKEDVVVNGIERKVGEGGRTGFEIDEIKVKALSLLFEFKGEMVFSTIKGVYSRARSGRSHLREMKMERVTMLKVVLEFVLFEDFLSSF